MTVQRPETDAGEACPDGRLRWRCRRGMRELDVLLERFVERRYAISTPEGRRAFLRLLDLPDPVILSFLMGRARPEEDALADVVRQITATARD